MQRDRFNEGQFRALAASEESKHAVCAAGGGMGRPLTAADRPTVAIGAGKIVCCRASPELKMNSGLIVQATSVALYLTVVSLRLAGG